MLTSVLVGNGGEGRRSSSGFRPGVCYGDVHYSSGDNTEQNGCRGKAVQLSKIVDPPESNGGSRDLACDLSSS